MEVRKCAGEGKNAFKNISKSLRDKKILKIKEIVLKCYANMNYRNCSIIPLPKRQVLTANTANTKDILTDVRIKKKRILRTLNGDFKEKVTYRNSR